MVIITSVETLDRSWMYCYTGSILGRPPRTKETLPDFCENMDPDKWDTIVWYQVTQRLQVFSRLTVGQRTPGSWGVTVQFCMARVWGVRGQVGKGIGHLVYSSWHFSYLKL